MGIGGGFPSPRYGVYPYHVRCLPHQYLNFYWFLRLLVTIKYHQIVRVLLLVTSVKHEVSALFRGKNDLGSKERLAPLFPRKTLVRKQLQSIKGERPEAKSTSILSPIAPPLPGGFPTPSFTAVINSATTRRMQMLRAAFLTTNLRRRRESAPPRAALITQWNLGRKGWRV